MTQTSASSCCRACGSSHLLNGVRRVVCTIYYQRVRFGTSDLYTYDSIAIMTSRKESLPHCYFHCSVSRNVLSLFTLFLVPCISTLSLVRRTLLSPLCLPIWDNGQTVAPLLPHLCFVILSCGNASFLLSIETHEVFILYS